MRTKLLLVAAGAAMTLQACSSRPREFVPTPGAASTNRAAFDAAYGECQQLMIAGKLDQNGRSSSLGAGAAAGATTAAVGAGTAAAIGGYGGLAAASATVVLLPFAVIGGAWGMAKMKRAKKEKAIQTAMSGCLAERGHRIEGWTRTGHKAVSTAG